ncbi:MAG: hypothetical protein RRY34_08915, partial [Victivallaceae bacterium]
VIKLVWALKSDRVRHSLTFATYFGGVLFVTAVILLTQNIFVAWRQSQITKAQMQSFEGAIMQYQQEFGQYPESLFFIPNSQTYDKKNLWYRAPDLIGKDEVYLYSTDQIFAYRKKLGKDVEIGFLPDGGMMLYPEKYTLEVK